MEDQSPDETPEAELREEESPEGLRWLDYARNAYIESTTWFDANKRRQIERNIDNFHSRHASGSKYKSDAYKGRSRLFMPKTRSNIRSKEASCGQAYFSTGDVLNVEANDARDPLQLVAANMHKALLDFRLTKTIPWFLIVLGAFQEAQVTGVAIAHMYWDFLEVGGKVKRDRPWVELIPVENFRFHPNANWLDPVNDSPYLIYRYPMTIGDVKAKMAGSGSGPQWKTLDDGALMRGIQNNEDSTALAREQQATGRHDPSAISAFSTVWIHLNVVREMGQDFVFWTLDTVDLLTDPVPLEEVWHHGLRPFVMGYANLEAHRNHPSAPIQLGQDVQAALNDSVNQRRDNVALVLNRRYKVLRGKNVDMRALSRSTPGGIILMDDLRAVDTDQMPDVTSSSYAEQDRLQMAFDDVSGGFSSSTVQGARALNETVGGMELISNGTNEIKEYELRVFNETFVEPVITQLRLLEALYETDEVVLKLAADAIELIQELRDPTLMSILLEQELTTTVSVGLGATNPMQRMQKLLQGVQATAPLLGPQLNGEEVGKEVWGILGYKDGGRFIIPKDQIQPPQPPVDPARMAMAQVAQGKLELEMERFQFDSQLEIQRLQAEQEDRQVQASLKQAEIVGRRDVMIAQIASRENIALEQVRANFDSTSFDRELAQNEQRLKEAEIATKRQIAAIQERSKMMELKFKATTGREGI